MLVLGLTACVWSPTPAGTSSSNPTGGPPTITPTGSSPTDADGDGWFIPDDCDDANPGAHPGAVEIFYDGIDEACDGGSDFDADGDGFDLLETGDCDDADPAAGAPQIPVCGNGVDDDCNDLSDCLVGRQDLPTVARTVFEGVDGAPEPIGDVDGDGLADVLLHGSFSYLWYAPAPGTLHQASRSAAFQGEIVAGDLTGDGALDVVFRHAQFDGVVHLFDQPVYGEADAATAFVDVDALPDLAYAGQTENATLGDVDADGHLDLVVADQAGARGIAVLQGPITTDLSPADVDTLITTGRGNLLPALVSDDLTGDGAADILAVIDGSCSTWDAWLLEQPSGAVDVGAAATWHDETPSGPGELRGAGDLDGDGSADLVAAARHDFANAQWFAGPFLACPCFDAPATTFAPEGVRHVAPAGDVDGDGQDDLLLGGAEDLRGAWLVLGPVPLGALDLATATGVGRFDAADPYNVGPVAGPGDVDGDGLDDLLFGTEGGWYWPDAAVWLVSGAGGL